MFTPQAADLSLTLDKDHKISFNLAGQPTRSLIVGQGAAQAMEWVATLEVCGEELSDTTRSTLEEVKTNCTTLDELDPDNKCKSSFPTTFHPWDLGILITFQYSTTCVGGTQT